MKNQKGTYKVKQALIRLLSKKKTNVENHSSVVARYEIKKLTIIIYFLIELVVKNQYHKLKITFSATCLFNDDNFLAVRKINKTLVLTLFDITTTETFFSALNLQTLQFIIMSFSYFGDNDFSTNKN